MHKKKIARESESGRQRKTESKKREIVVKCVSIFVCMREQFQS